MQQAAQVKLLAIAMLLAELADNEPLTDPTKHKFARKLTDVAVELAEDKNVGIGITQTALHALGKITPPPADAIKVLEARLKQKNDAGPRRVAAYALIDLVKNASTVIDLVKNGFVSVPANQLQTVTLEQLQTITGVVATAQFGVEDAAAEESIRGHCLIAIRDAAKALSESIRTIDTQFALDQQVDMKPLRAELNKALVACESVSPALGQTLTDGRSSANIRLASIDALTQLARLRAKVLPYLPKEQKDPDGFKAADPLGKIEARVGEAAAVLLSKDADRRERYGAIVFLDLLGASARDALPQITRAMCDSDGLVRYTAARMIRHFPYHDDKTPSPVSNATIVALGILLLDPDPDINVAAAESLEALGPQAGAAIERLSSAVTIGDVENRVAAMRIVGNLGTPIAVTAYPAVIAALTDAEPRVTRRAAETLGQFGAIAMRNHATADPSLPALLDGFRAAALPALTKALRDADSETRLNAFARERSDPEHWDAEEGIIITSPLSWSTRRGE